MWFQKEVSQWLLCSRNLNFFFATLTLDQVEPPARKCHGYMGCKQSAERRLPEPRFNFTAIERAIMSYLP